MIACTIAELKSKQRGTDPCFKSDAGLVNAYATNVVMFPLVEFAILTWTSALNAFPLSKRV